MNIPHPFLKSVRFFLIVFIVHFSSCLANNPEQQDKLNQAQFTSREQLDADFARFTGKDPSTLSEDEKLKALQDLMSPVPLELLVGGEDDQDEEEAGAFKNFNRSLNPEAIRILNDVGAMLKDDAEGKLYEILREQEEGKRAYKREKLRSKIIMGLIHASGGENLTKPVEEEKDPEAHFYRPKGPKLLSQEEKKVEIEDRIARKYIGQIPSQVKDVIFYFSNHEECVRDNVEIYNRVLLYGKPGTGKTHLVSVVSEELELPLFLFSASFFADKYIGETSRRIRKAFEAVKKLNKPVIVFIDEIDALATKRQENTHSEHRSALITLLTEIQELQDNKNIVVFASTNDIEALDPALRDRFAGSISEIKELNLQERKELFQLAFAKKGLPIDDELALRFAQVTKPSSYDVETKEYKNRFSNRDIEYIVVTALLKRRADLKKNPKNEKHLSAYVREAMDATEKEGSFAWFKSTYGNGI